jgi:hypothetical protein
MIESKEQQIDLVSLAIRCISFIRRRFILIALIFIIGIGAAIADYFLSKDEYSTQFVISTPIFNSSIVSTLSQPLEFYIATNNIDSVASIMGISTKIASEICEFKQDTSISGVVLIDVIYSNPEIVDSIRTGLVYFYNNLNYVKQEISNKKIVLQEQISVLEEKITTLNQIQELELKAIQEGNFTGFESKGQSFNDIVMLYEKLYELKNDYNRLKPFSVINQSLVATKANSLIKLIAIYGIAALILGFLFSLFMELRYLMKNKTSVG